MRELWLIMNSSVLLKSSNLLRNKAQYDLAGLLKFGNCPDVQISDLCEESRIKDVYSMPEYCDVCGIKLDSKPKPYIINTIKHLLLIGQGIYPGFIPSLNSEIAAPVSTIQDAYMNSYLLKQYGPIIMQPHHLKSSVTPVYIYYHCLYLLNMPIKRICLAS